ncbi:MAG: hypothetical protein A2X36_03045 [Elusimicrobia bacterium GWA2_69_24]|nr:MAG: hypothetical protein A2X36_03045 [Elusimicrobia bacterium GWA2_69_24]
MFFKALGWVVEFAVLVIIVSAAFAAFYIWGNLSRDVCAEEAGILSCTEAAWPLGGAWLFRETVRVKLSDLSAIQIDRRSAQKRLFTSSIRSITLKRGFLRDKLTIDCGFWCTEKFYFRKDQGNAVRLLLALP